MKVKEGFALRDICGEKVLIAEGLENIDFSKLINLNETAAYLWEHLSETEFEIEDMVDLLTDEYEVTEEVAIEDCKQLVADWQKAGLLQ